MSKRSWDVGVVKFVKSKKQTFTLAVGRKCRKHWSGRSQILYEVADSFQFLHPSRWECQKKQDGVLVLFFKYIWFSII